MHTTNQLLDLLAKKFGGASDYRLAKLLNTSTSGVTSYRKGRRVMSADFAVRIALLLEWDPAYVIACVEHERAERAAREAHLEQTQEILKTWERIAKRFAPATKHAAIVIAALMLGVGLIPEPVRAVTPSPAADSQLTRIYIMRTRHTARRW